MGHNHMTLSTDRAFRLLADANRRRLLLELHDDEATLDVVAGNRNEDIEMHHIHLPKLDDAGIIEWDREAGTVTRGPNWDEVTDYLEFARNQQSAPQPA